MKLEQSELHIGLNKPLKILHVTDSHLTRCDDRDDERKQALAASRKAAFWDEDDHAQRFLDEHIAYAHEHCDLMVHTGDIMDFVSQANVDYARQFVRDEKVFFAPGNHEYSLYVGEAWEDSAYRMNSYMIMGGGLGIDMFYCSKVVGGVNFVAIDNVYYQFEDWQIWRLKKDVQKGLPVILAFHDPLFEQSLYDTMMERTWNSCAYVVGCDEDHLQRYEEFRAVQQRPTDATLRMIDYIAHEPAIKAILTGHVHINHESTLPGGVRQIITAGGFEGYAREITIT